MVTIGQKCLRALVLLLLVATLGIDITTFVKNWIYIHVGRDPSPEWQNWASMFLEATLALIYFLSLLRAMFMRHLRPLNRWLRAVTITILLTFDLALAVRGLQDPLPYGEIWASPGGHAKSPDDLYRMWFKLAIAAMVVTLIEVVYTLYRCHRDPPPMPSKPETIIIVSPEQHHYGGIQPNMSMPYGTAQSQPYHLQQQPVYPQPVHPNYTQPYLPPIQPATVLSPQQQAILQNQSSLKHEDSSQIIQEQQLQEHYPYAAVSSTAYTPQPGSSSSPATYGSDAGTLSRNVQALPRHPQEQ